MKNQNSPPDKNENYKSRRKFVLELGFICSMILLSSLFYSFKKFENTNKLIIPRPDGPTKVIFIPPTKQPEKIVRPTVPSILLPKDDDEFCKAVEFDPNNIDIGVLIKNSAPPVDEEEEIAFENVEVKPELIVKVQPDYPDMAKRSGTTGLVVVSVLIDKKGNVEKAEIFKSSPLLDKAALDAAKRFKFKPAMQRDKYVKVRMYIPFKFALR